MITVTDEMVARLLDLALRIDADGTASQIGSAEEIREIAASLSLQSPPVGEIAEGGGETERLVRATQWLQDRWSEKHPNTAHIRQLADYETFLRALSAAPASPANGWQTMETAPTTEGDQ